MNTNSGHAKKPWARGTATFLAAMLVVSVALNVALAYKVRDFTSAQEARLASIEARSLKPGAAVPPINAKRADRADAAVEAVTYAGTTRPTVLYVLSPTCGWCAKNEGSIKKLIAAKGRDYRFIGISLIEQGAAEYHATHALGVPLYVGLTEETKKAYKMGGTPQTIVVSPRGRVIANWNGAYVGKQKEVVETFFDVQLPDIAL